MRHDAPPSPTAYITEIFEITAWTQLIEAAPAELAKSTGLEVHRIGGIVAVVAPGIPSTEFNRAVGLGVAKPATEFEIAAIIDLYRSRKVECAWIQVMDRAAPPEIGRMLMAGGASQPTSQWVVVQRLAAPLELPPCSFRIDEIGAEHALEAARVFRLAYGLPEFFDAWNAALVGRPGWKSFAAFDGPRIVSVCHLFIEGDRAMLIGAATLPEMRGQGAQSALIARRIAEAYAQGVQWVQTHTWIPAPNSANPSLNNMLRAGLQPTHRRSNWIVVR